MLPALILIPATAALGLGFWRVGHGQDIETVANGLGLIVGGAIGIAVALLVAAVGG